MTTAFSSFLEEKVLGHTLLGSTYSSPATIWVCLSTSITSDGSNANATEVTTNTGYVRQAVGRNWTSVTSKPDSTVSTSVALTYPAATTPWGVVAHVFLTDSASIGQGNVLYHGTLDNSRDVQTDDVFEFAAGSLAVKIS